VPVDYFEARRESQQSEGEQQRAAARIYRRHRVVQDTPTRALVGEGVRVRD